MLILSNIGDIYPEFQRIGLHLVMEILFLFIYLFIFAAFLNIFSSWIFFQVQIQNEYYLLYFFQINFRLREEKPS